MALSTHTHQAFSGHLVKGIKELVDAGIPQVPERYIRPLEQRPCLDDVCELQVLVVDVSGIQGQRRCHVIREIGLACAEWGFFQVVNHGVPPCVIDRMWSAAHQFFDQPAEDRMQFYSDDFNTEVAYTTSFNPSKESTLEWKDALRLRYKPGVFDGFQQAPSFCRGPAIDYLEEMRILGNTLYRAIFESAGLGSDYLDKALPDIPKMEIAIHYYASCPDPSLTFGLSGHSDFGCVTILMQDDVGGLQVLKEGRWTAVKPVPNAYIVNIGDQIEILTNGKYKSVEHRVITNSEKPRMSIASFLNPAMDTKISPLNQLVDDSNPALYRETLFGDYFTNSWAKHLDSKDNLKFSKAP